MSEETPNAPKRRGKRRGGKKKPGAKTEMLAATPRRVPQSEDNTMRIWLISFTDIFALLVTFFVMLFSMSTPKIDAWTNIVTALDAEFHTRYGAVAGPGIHAEEEMDRAEEEKAFDIGYLGAVLQLQLEQVPELDHVTLTTYDDHVVLTLPRDLLFEQDSAEIGEAGREALDKLQRIFNGLRNRIEIYGHTGPEAHKSEAYGSNWGLSLARAVNTGRILEEMGYHRDIAVFGLADHKYGAIPATLPDAERKRRAQRVEILIREHAHGVAGGL